MGESQYSIRDLANEISGRSIEKLNSESLRVGKAGLPPLGSAIQSQRGQATLPNPEIPELESYLPNPEILKLEPYIPEPEIPEAEILELEPYIGGAVRVCVRVFG